jgi:hypothetical protein
MKAKWTTHGLGQGSGVVAVVVVVAQMLTGVAMPMVLSLTLTSAQSGWGQAADVVSVLVGMRSGLNPDGVRCVV